MSRPRTASSDTTADSVHPSIRTTRRNFLRAGGASAAVLLAGKVGVNRPAQAQPLLVSGDADTTATTIVPLDARRSHAVRLRMATAQRQAERTAVDHPLNDDETRYPACIANFSKGLPHDDLGEVSVAAYHALVAALEGSASFADIPLGGTLKLANPQAALAYQLEGADSHDFTMTPPPPFASAESAAAMCELYWMALARDIPFAHYGDEPITAAAIADLAQLHHLEQVDQTRLFRGETPADLIGPYLSQFLSLPIPYGPTLIDQRYRVPVAGDDYLTDFAEWLQIQNGVATQKQNTYDLMPRYLCSGRDLAAWVHDDFTYQAYLNAALILNHMGPNALDESNPYKRLSNQSGFVTFGAADILSLLANVACLSLKAAWAQKWLFHRYLRPEEFGGRVHNHLTGATAYPLHITLLRSTVLDEIFHRFGSYLLPQAYPEGCPSHPSYPAGHAVVAGACVTVLKAFFNEAFVLPEPKIATTDGSALVDYRGSAALTVGGELNKLAANIALGRNFAGIHWRADMIGGLRLGEAVAVSVLSDLTATYTEPFSGFRLTGFDGAAIHIQSPQS